MTPEEQSSNRNFKGIVKGVWKKGGSLGVILPSQVVEVLELKAGGRVVFVVESGKKVVYLANGDYLKVQIKDIGDQVSIVE